MKRLEREQRTLDRMLAMYCRAKHNTRGALCTQCERLRAYGVERLRRCPFGGGKPTCFRCPIDCYGSVQRERIREVMRCSGPRMIVRHPLLAVLHLLDGFRSRPAESGPRT